MVKLHYVTLVTLQGPLMLDVSYFPKDPVLIGDDVVPRILCSCAMLRWLSSRRLVCKSLCASVGLARWFPALEVAPLVGGRVPVELPRT